MNADEGGLDKMARPEPFFLSGLHSDLCVLMPSVLSARLVALARARGMRCERDPAVWKGTSPSDAAEDLVRFPPPVFLPAVEEVIDDFCRSLPAPVRVAPGEAA